MGPLNHGRAGSNPALRSATTADDATSAFTELGSGPPTVIWMPSLGNVVVNAATGSAALGRFERAAIRRLGIDACLRLADS